MSKKNGWVPIDKNLINDLTNLGRPFTRLEAMLSYTVDQDNGKSGSIQGYSTLWSWSRNKVRRFIKDIKSTKGHSLDSRWTHIGHPVHLIDKGFQPQEDSKRTVGHSLDSKRTVKGHPVPLIDEGFQPQEDSKRTVDSKRTPCSLDWRGFPASRGHYYNPNTNIKNKKNKKRNGILPDYISEDLWHDFKEHRKELKSCMTERAEKLLIKKIDKMSGKKPDIAKALIEQSIENGWKGIFPLKENTTVQEKNLFPF